MSCNDNKKRGCSNLIKVGKKGDYRRDCFDLNKTTKIKILFKDSCDETYDPDLITITNVRPDGSFYDPVDVNKVSTGFYYYEITPDQIGTWDTIWMSSFNGVETVHESTFEVINNNITSKIKNGLEFNSLIVIELSNEIENESGTRLLESTQYLSFNSEYNPFYCSVEMIRMEMGSWIEQVEDSTIALAIHWSSLEADNITGVVPRNDRYDFARTRFVMYDAAIRLFTMPTSVNGNSLGKEKTLGDLMISNGNALDFNLKDLVNELKTERDEWWRVVNAGGCIVNGQGLGPGSAVNGRSRKDKNQRSREWHNPLEEYYAQPTQNSLYKTHENGKYKHGFRKIGYR